MIETTRIDIIPTCVPSSVRDLQTVSEKIRGFSHQIHVDVDDGIFAPMITWPYVAAGAYENVTLAPLAGMDIEVHLMVKDPKAIGEAFSREGAMRVIGHLEAFETAEEAMATLDLWRRSGAGEVGLSILVDTPLEKLDAVIAACDVVQVMSVSAIGAQGGGFDQRAIQRVADIHARFPKTLISADGGINADTVAAMVKAGATRFGVGSAILHDEEPAAAFASILATAKSAASN